MTELRLKLILLIVILVFPANNLEAAKCQAITKKGAQCKRNAQVDSLYCWQHKRVIEGNIQEDTTTTPPKTVSPSSSAWVVMEVIDGDTIELSTGEKVRYIGVNTPETGRTDAITRVLGEKAKAYNENLVLGKEVRLEFDVQQRDKFGRLLAYVYVDNIFVNAELVRQGYASASTFPPNVKYAGLFQEFEKEARENYRGLWGVLQVNPEGIKEDKR